MRSKLLIYTLIFTFVTADPITPAALAVTAGRQGESLPNAASLPADLTQFHIPSEIGKIEQAFIARGKETGDKRQENLRVSRPLSPAPLVILIQDAHAIPEAQRNIQKLIGHFQSQYGLKLIGVEGASSELDPQIFRSFPEQGLLKKTLEEYFEKGELTGATAAAIRDDKDGLYHGVEDWDLYQQGLALYLAAMEKEPEIASKLAIWEKELEEKKRRFYSKDLLEIDKTLALFWENKMNLPEILKVLSKVQAPEKGSEIEMILKESESQGNDQANIEAEVKKIAHQVRKHLEKNELPNEQRVFNQQYQEFQTSRITPQAFALYLKEIIEKGTGLPTGKAGNTSLPVPFLLSDRLLKRIKTEKRMRDIQGTKFFADFEAYADSVKGRLLTTDQVRALDRESSNLILAKRLAHLELSRKEWNEFKASKAETFQNGVHIPEARSNISELLQLPVLFYENAEKRDEALFNRLTGVMKERKTDQALMVAGGFHAEGLMQRFKDKNISYLLLTPRIGSVPEDSPYRDQMRGRVSWSDYFEVEGGKINLYKAFVRGTRDHLLKGQGARDEGKEIAFPVSPVSRPVLKAWRDQIIRDLSEKGQIERAGRYTVFLDEVAQKDEKPDATKRLEKIDHFVERLHQLEAAGKLTEQNILKLLQPAAVPPAVTASALAGDLLAAEIRIPGAANRLKLIHLPSRIEQPRRAEESSARSELRTPLALKPIASRSEVRAAPEFEDSVLSDLKVVIRNQPLGLIEDAEEREASDPRLAADRLLSYVGETPVSGGGLKRIWRGLFGRPDIDLIFVTSFHRVHIDRMLEEMQEHSFTYQMLLGQDIAQKQAVAYLALLSLSPRTFRDWVYFRTGSKREPKSILGRLSRILSFLWIMPRMFLAMSSFRNGFTYLRYLFSQSNIPLSDIRRAEPEDITKTLIKEGGLEALARLDFGSPAESRRKFLVHDIQNALLAENVSKAVEEIVRFVESLETATVDTKREELFTAMRGLSGTFLRNDQLEDLSSEMLNHPDLEDLELSTYQFELRKAIFGARAEVRALKDFQFGFPLGRALTAEEVADDVKQLFEKNEIRAVYVLEDLEKANSNRQNIQPLFEAIGENFTPEALIDRLQEPPFVDQKFRIDKVRVPDGDTVQFDVIISTSSKYTYEGWIQDNEAQLWEQVQTPDPDVIKAALNHTDRAEYFFSLHEKTYHGRMTRHLNLFSSVSSSLQNTNSFLDEWVFEPQSALASIYESLSNNEPVIDLDFYREIRLAAREIRKLLVRRASPEARSEVRSINPTGTYAAKMEFDAVVRDQYTFGAARTWLGNDYKARDIQVPAEFLNVQISMQHDLWDKLGEGNVPELFQNLLATLGSGERKKIADQGARQKIVIYAGFKRGEEEDEIDPVHVIFSFNHETAIEVQTPNALKFDEDMTLDDILPLERRDVLRRQLSASARSEVRAKFDDYTPEILTEIVGKFFEILEREGQDAQKRFAWELMAVQKKVDAGGPIDRNPLFYLARRMEQYLRELEEVKTLVRDNEQAVKYFKMLITQLFIVDEFMGAVSENEGLLRQFIESSQLEPERNKPWRVRDPFDLAQEIIEKVFTGEYRIDIVDLPPGGLNIERFLVPGLHIVSFDGGVPGPHRRASGYYYFRSNFPIVMLRQNGDYTGDFLFFDPSRNKPAINKIANLGDLGQRLIERTSLVFSLTDAKARMELARAVDLINAGDELDRRRKFWEIIEGVRSNPELATGENLSLLIERARKDESQAVREAAFQAISDFALQEGDQNQIRKIDESRTEESSFLRASFWRLVERIQKDPSAATEDALQIIMRRANDEFPAIRSVVSSVFHQDPNRLAYLMRYMWEQASRVADLRRTIIEILIHSPEFSDIFSIRWFTLTPALESALGVALAESQTDPEKNLPQYILNATREILQDEAAAFLMGLQPIGGKIYLGPGILPKNMKEMNKLGISWNGGEHSILFPVGYSYKTHVRILRYLLANTLEIDGVKSYHYSVAHQGRMDDRVKYSFLSSISGRPFTTSWGDFRMTLGQTQSRVGPVTEGGGVVQPLRGENLGDYDRTDVTDLTDGSTKLQLFARDQQILNSALYLRIRAERAASKPGRKLRPLNSTEEGIAEMHKRFQRGLEKSFKAGGLSGVLQVPWLFKEGTTNNDLEGQLYGPRREAPPTPILNGLVEVEEAKMHPDDLEVFRRDPAAPVRLSKWAGDASSFHLTSVVEIENAFVAGAVERAILEDEKNVTLAAQLVARHVKTLTRDFDIPVDSLSSIMGNLLNQIGSLSPPFLTEASAKQFVGKLIQELPLFKFREQEFLDRVRARSEARLPGTRRPARAEADSTLAGLSPQSLKPIASRAEVRSEGSKDNRIEQLSSQLYSNDPDKRQGAVNGLFELAENTAESFALRKEALRTLLVMLFDVKDRILIERPMVKEIGIDKIRWRLVKDHLEMLLKASNAAERYGLDNGLALLLSYPRIVAFLGPSAGSNDQSRSGIELNLSEDLRREWNRKLTETGKIVFDIFVKRQINNMEVRLWPGDSNYEKVIRSDQKQEFVKNLSMELKKLGLFSIEISDIPENEKKIHFEWQNSIYGKQGIDIDWDNPQAVNYALTASILFAFLKVEEGEIERDEEILRDHMPFLSLNELPFEFTLGRSLSAEDVPATLNNLIAAREVQAIVLINDFEESVKNKKLYPVLRMNEPYAELSVDTIKDVLMERYAQRRFRLDRLAMSEGGRKFKAAVISPEGSSWFFNRSYGNVDDRFDEVDEWLQRSNQFIPAEKFQETIARLEEILRTSQQDLAGFRGDHLRGRVQGAIGELRLRRFPSALIHLYSALTRVGELNHPDSEEPPVLLEPYFERIHQAINDIRSVLSRRSEVRNLMAGVEARTGKQIERMARGIVRIGGIEPGALQKIIAAYRENPEGFVDNLEIDLKDSDNLFVLQADKVDGGLYQTSFDKADLAAVDIKSFIRDRVRQLLAERFQSRAEVRHSSRDLESWKGTAFSEAFTDQEKIVFSRAEAEKFAPGKLLLFDAAEKLGLKLVLTGGTARDFAISSIAKKEVLPRSADYDLVFLFPRGMDENEKLKAAFNTPAYERYEAEIENIVGKNAVVDRLLGEYAANGYAFEQRLRGKAGRAFSISRLGVEKVGDQYVVFGHADAMQDLRQEKLRVWLGENQTLGGERTSKMMGKVAVYKDLTSFDLVSDEGANYIEKEINQIRDAGRLNRDAMDKFMQGLYEAVQLLVEDTASIENRLRRTIRDWELADRFGMTEDELVRLAASARAEVRSIEEVSSQIQTVQNELRDLFGETLVPQFAQGFAERLPSAEPALWVDSEWRLREQTAEELQRIAAAGIGDAGVFADGILDPDEHFSWRVGQSFVSLGRIYYHLRKSNLDFTGLDSQAQTRLREQARALRRYIKLLFEAGFSRSPQEDIRLIQTLHLRIPTRDLILQEGGEDIAPVTSLVFSPDGQRLAWGENHGRIVQRNLQTNETDTVQAEEEDDPAGTVSTLAYSPDGQKIAWGRWYGIAQRNLPTGDTEMLINVIENSIGAFAFSSDGQRIVVGDDNGTIAQRNLQTNEIEIIQQGQELGDGILALAYSPDSQRVVWGDHRGRVVRRNLQTGETEILAEAREINFRSFAFSPDEQKLAVGNNSGQIFLRNLQTGDTEIIQEGDAVFSLAFSTDSQSLAWGDSQGTVRVRELLPPARSELRATPQEEEQKREELRARVENDLADLEGRKEEILRVKRELGRELEQVTQGLDNENFINQFRRITGYLNQISTRAEVPPLELNPEDAALLPGNPSPAPTPEDLRAMAANQSYPRDMRNAAADLSDALEEGNRDERIQEAIHQLVNLRDALNVAILSANSGFARIRELLTNYTGLIYALRSDAGVLRGSIDLARQRDVEVTDNESKAQTINLENDIQSIFLISRTIQAYNNWLSGHVGSESIIRENMRLLRDRRDNFPVISSEKLQVDSDTFMPANTYAIGVTIPDGQILTSWAGRNDVVEVSVRELGFGTLSFSRDTFQRQNITPPRSFVEAIERINDAAIPRPPSGPSVVPPAPPTRPPAPPGPSDEPPTSLQPTQPPGPPRPPAPRPPEEPTRVQPPSQPVRPIRPPPERRSELRERQTIPLPEMFPKVWAAVVVDEALTGKEVSRAEIRKASEIVVTTGAAPFADLLKAVAAHADQSDVVKREQLRLIQAYKERFPDQTLVLGVIFPEEMNAAELEDVSRSLKEINADTLVVPRRLNKFLDVLQQTGVHLQQVDFSRPVYVGQDALSVAVFEDQAGFKMDKMFVPFRAQGSETIEDYFIRAQVRFVQLLSTGIAAQLLKENPELKDDPAQLKAELLKVLGPQYANTIHPRGDEFVVSALEVRVVTEYLARAEIRKAA